MSDQNENSVTLNEIGVSMNDVTEETRNSLIMKMDPNAIPDLNKLLHGISDLLNDVESDSMRELQKIDKNQYETILTHKHYDTIQSNKIINLLIEPTTKIERENNLHKLLDMFERLQNIKDGKLNMQDGYKDWCEKMNEEYVYSKHGGKENFEKVMKETQEKNKIKQKN
jgi:hypothetical protein